MLTWISNHFSQELEDNLSEVLDRAGIQVYHHFPNIPFKNVSGNICVCRTLGLQYILMRGIMHLFSPMESDI